MLKQFKESVVLFNINQKRLKRHPVFKPPSNDWKYMYKSFNIVKLRALVLLKLIYPDGIYNFIDSNMYKYFFYVPSQKMFIDYFQFISHTGPYNQTRTFDPSNKDDLLFLDEIKKFSKREKEKYWVSIDRAYTWAGIDYQKYLYIKMNRKKYKIFWSISQIEDYATQSHINASWQIINSYYMLIQLYNIIFYRYNILLNKKYNTDDLNYIQDPIGIFL